MRKLQVDMDRPHRHGEGMKALKKGKDKGGKAEFRDRHEHAESGKSEKGKR